MNRRHIAQRARIKNSAWRVEADTNFLRNTLVVLRQGIMEYAQGELAGMPAHLQMARVYVSPEVIRDAAAIASLEGKPIVVGHIWQDCNTVTASCGNIAGTPYATADGAELLSDILVTDRDAARRVMLEPGDPEKLEEVSSGFDAVVIWEPGVSPNGEPYDGYFVDVRYNHLALLPAGCGRGGELTRILNQSEAMLMDYTKMRLRSGRFVRVVNEDVPLLEADIADGDAAAAVAVSPEKLQETLDELATLKAEREKLNARIDELQGALEATKEQLEEATSDDAVEAAAELMNEEREEADKVMVANGLSLTAEQRKLRGTPLRAVVVNALRVKNGKPALTAEQAGNEHFVRGVFNAHHDMLPAGSLPAGYQAAQVTNAHANPGAHVPLTGKAQFDALYGKKKGA